MYAETAGSIRRLKVEAYKATTQEKFAYRSPDGKTFRNKRPDQQLMDAGWTYGKVKFQQVESCISPRHKSWQEYRQLKRRATRLLGVRLILKANEGNVPAKSEIGPLLAMRVFRSHARTASAQKTLAYSSYRYVQKLENRLRNQPQRFTAVEAWIKERAERELRND